MVTPWLEIEVAYANSETEALISLAVVPESTVDEAILKSGILDQFPEIDLDQNKLGIFSKIVKLNHKISAGDRIEIYRNLLIDPKQARHLRAKSKK